MILKSFFTITIDNPSTQAIHLHHVLYMQSLYAHHGERLPASYWQHQGKCQYSYLLRTLLKHTSISGILDQSEIIFLVYRSHEYNPREHLAGVIQTILSRHANITDIIDCEQEALPVALMLAKQASAHTQHISIVCLEQKTQHPWQATRHDTIHNSVSLLSTVPSEHHACDIAIEHLAYDDCENSIQHYLDLPPSRRPACISNRLELLESLPTGSHQRLLIHGYTDLMRHLSQFHHQTYPAQLWVHLTSAQHTSGYCLWLSTQHNRRMH